MSKSNRSTEQNNRKALLIGNAFFNKKFGIFLLALTLTVATVVLLYMNNSGKKLVIEDLQDGDIMWQEQVNQGDWFSHRYIHSVEKSPVIEKFKINQEWTILTMESWTKSFGAGLPYEDKGDVKMENGFFIIQNLNRPVFGGELKFQPSDLFPHSFRFKDQEVTLSEPPYSDTQILVTVKDETFLDWAVSLF